MKKKSQIRIVLFYTAQWILFAVFSTGCLLHVDDFQPSITEVNLSNFNQASPTTGQLFVEVQELTAEMDSLRQRGLTNAVDSVSHLRDIVYEEVRMLAKRDIRITLDTIPQLDYVITGATGMYLGGREPSVVVTLIGENLSLHDRAVSALSIYAQNERQMSIIESLPYDLNSSWYGHGEGLYSYEPSVSFTLTDGVSLDALSDRLLLNRFEGFTIRHQSTSDKLDIYYIPAFEIDNTGNGRSRDDFLADIDRFEQETTVRGWVSGRTEIVRKLRVHLL